MFLSNWFTLLATVTSSGWTEKKTVLKSTYLMSYFFFLQDEVKEHLEKKERGELAGQKMDFLKENILKPVKWVLTQ